MKNRLFKKHFKKVSKKRPNKLFKITFSTRTKDFYSSAISKKQLTLDGENYRSIKLLCNRKDYFPYGKLNYTIENGWVYLRGETPRSFSNPCEISRVYWMLGNKVIVEAKNIKEAFKILLNFISYSHIPKKTDSVLFIDKTLAGAIYQKRITEKTPIPKSKLNLSNWPIKIQSIEIFEKCPKVFIFENSLMCEFCKEDGKPNPNDIANFCMIGCRESSNFWESMDYPIELVKGKNDLETNSFPVIDHTKIV